MSHSRPYLGLTGPRLGFIVLPMSPIVNKDFEIPAACRESLRAKLLGKITVDSTGCWIWKGPSDVDGYGKMSALGRSDRTHRVSYAIHVGPIPRHLCIDHLCRNRLCCNPLHLECVTHKVNLLRGEGIAAKCARATHCPKGHAYDDTNTYLRPQGGRDCRICRRQLKLASVERLKK